MQNIGEHRKLIWNNFCNKFHILKSGVDLFDCDQARTVTNRILKSPANGDFRILDQDKRARIPRSIFLRKFFINPSPLTHFFFSVTNYKKENQCELR